MLPMIKHNHNHSDAATVSAKQVPIYIEFADIKATLVFIAVTFNQRQPGARTRHSSGAGEWWKEMFLEGHIRQPPAP